METIEEYYIICLPNVNITRINQLFDIVTKLKLKHSVDSRKKCTESITKDEKEKSAKSN